MSSGSEPMIKIIGRKYVSSHLAVILNIISFGFVYIACRLSLNFRILMHTTGCSLEESDCVVLEDQYGRRTIIPIEVVQTKPTLTLKRYIKDNTCKILDTCYGRFIFDNVLERFVLPHYNPPHAGKSFENLYRERILCSREEEGLEIYEKSIIYGKNTMNLKIPGKTEIVLSNIIEPLFLWKIISLVVWYFVDYGENMAIMSVIFAVILAVKIRNEFRNRDELISNIKQSNVKIVRDGMFRLLPEGDIIPGDIIYIECSDNFTCDVEILKGDVIADESFLTGESVPICKGPGIMVYSGTKILKSSLSSEPIKNIQMQKLVKVKNLAKKSTSEPIREFQNANAFEDLATGIVIKTGKQTKRGTLFKNLLTKKPGDSEFMNQINASMRPFLYFIVFLMFALFLYFCKWGGEQLTLKENIIRTIDAGLTFFSPSLYTCLELGIQHAQKELLSKHVNTTDSSRINVAGEINTVIFDKTGTLTELGVDIHCFDTMEKVYKNVEELDIIARMALSTCHHVIVLDNQHSGDELDMKMFLFSQSKIFSRDSKRFIEMEVKNKYEAVCKEYSEKDGDLTLFFNAENSSTGNNEVYPEDTLEIIKIYEFDLYLKAISVVVKDHTGKMFLFCKGAPDMLAKMIKSVPKDYSEQVREYSLQGHRVLSVAYKEITEFTGRREADEANLDFIGFLVFANKLKEETMAVVQELREANLNPKMCTGDNILTAISVAKECGMIEQSIPVLFPVLEDDCKTFYDVGWFCIADEDYVFDKFKMQLYSAFDKETAYDFVIAVEANEFNFFKNTIYHTLIMEKGVIFARFNPDNKKQLMEEYYNLGIKTLFCGDGANDTGALCSADVGVSLSKNEASLAAPFNSVNLTAVLDVIKEGRSALCMSAVQFEYIFYLQALAGVQISVLLFFFVFPSNRMSLTIDLMGIYILGYSLCNFKAAPKLFAQKFRPKISLGILASALELIVMLTVFFIPLYLFSETIDNTCIKNESRRSTFLFFSSVLLLILKAYLFADFGPFRESRNKNSFFLMVISACVAFVLSVFGLYILKVEFIWDAFKFTNLTSSENIYMCLHVLGVLAVALLPFKTVARKILK